MKQPREAKLNSLEEFPALSAGVERKSDRVGWLSKRSTSGGRPPFEGCRSEERLGLAAKTEGFVLFRALL